MFVWTIARKDPLYFVTLLMFTPNMKVMIFKLRIRKDYCNPSYLSVDILNTLFSLTNKFGLMFGGDRVEQTSTALEASKFES